MELKRCDTSHSTKLAFPALPQVDVKKKTRKEQPRTASGDPHETHLLLFKTKPCKENCSNVYVCTKFHSCEDRRRPLTFFADANVPNYQPVMCNAIKGSAVCIHQTKQSLSEIRSFMLDIIAGSGIVLR